MTEARKSKAKKLAAAALFLLGGFMIFLGLRAEILAPSVTGIGFFVIAGVFLLD